MGLFTNFGIMASDSGAVLEYLGIASGLSGGGYHPPIVSNGTHILANTGGSNIEVWNSNLVRLTPITASNNHSDRGRAEMAGSNFIFAGGGSYASSTDAYNSSLVKITCPSLSQDRTYLSSASLSSGVLFAGGQIPGVVSTDIVDMYNISLVRTSSTLTSARQYMPGVTIGNNALFAGGYDASTQNNTTAVDAFNTSFVRSSATALSFGPNQHAGASTSKHAIVGGGNNIKSVNAYDDNLVRYIAPNLSLGGWSNTAAGFDELMAFFGGQTSTGPSSAVDVYDTSLVRVTGPDLPGNKSGASGVAIGNKALIVGSDTNVYVYQVS